MGSEFLDSDTFVPSAAKIAQEGKLALIWDLRLISMDRLYREIVPDSLSPVLTSKAFKFII
jgi:hypothetical protein